MRQGPEHHRAVAGLDEPAQNADQSAMSWRPLRELVAAAVTKSDR
jgi:hypothetical protein